MSIKHFFFFNHILLDGWTESRQLAKVELPSYVNLPQLKLFVMAQEMNEGRFKGWRTLLGQVSHFLLFRWNIGVFVVYEPYCSKYVFPPFAINPGICGVHWSVHYSLCCTKLFTFRFEEQVNLRWEKSILDNHTQTKEMHYCEKIHLLSPGCTSTTA